MAITDIISEEIETRAPNMEVAQGSPDDFMTEDEMDPSNDPELQQLLDSLPGEQAEVLMQLIKEFKAMVAQGFTGEFEDFVKMKMASAQGGPEDFMSEEEMIISPEEQQSIIPMGQQVAQGGRIGYDNGGPTMGNPPVFEEIEDMREWRIANPDVEDVADYKGYYDRLKNPEDYDKDGFKKKRNKKYEGGIMDVVAEEQVETGPTTQQIIMKWLNDRGLPITPENIQRAIMEMSREGKTPAMTRQQSLMPQMEMPRPPTGSDYIPEELIGQDITETVTPDITAMIPRAKPEDDIFSDQEMIDMKQKYIDEGGTFDKASWGIEEDEVEKDGIMQLDDSITYTDDEEPYTSDMFKGSANTLLRGMYGAPDSREYLQDELKNRIDKYKRHNPEVTDEEIHEIIRGENYSISDLLRQQSFKAPFNLAQGGRAGYGLGSLVKSIFKGGKKLVKNLTKSVKKFAKSDLGKMALGYLATAGLANVGAAGGFGKASWANPFTKGTGWLRPSSVLSNIGKSYGNLFSKSPAITEASKAVTSNISPQLSNAIVGDASLAGKSKNILNWAGKTPDKGGLFSRALGSFKEHPMPWILGSSALAGLYTAKNPGEDNLDNVMANYKGEVANWDKMIADIRAGQGVTPFATDNVLFPYPDYYQLAGGGRVGRAEGGIMDLGGLEKDYRNEGGFVPIGKKEKADDVPARLSVNEFVFTADAVRNAGGGDVDKGAEVMENVMTNLEQGGSISEESQGLEGARDMFEVSERLSEVV